MFCATSKTEGEVGAVGLVWVPSNSLLTLQGGGLLWFSVACFGVRFKVTFHLTCVYIIFCSVSVSERPPFGK